MTLYGRPRTEPLEERVLRGELPREETAMPRQTIAEKSNNVVAITIGVVSLVCQICTWVWWGGRIDERVTKHDVFIEQQGQINSNTATAIAVTQTKLDNIKQVVERIDRNVEARK